MQKCYRTVPKVTIRLETRVPPEVFGQAKEGATAVDLNPSSNAAGAAKFWQLALAESVLIADPASIELAPDPIRQEWVLSGQPQASSRILTRSRDWLSVLAIWECTAGRFRWEYTRDEILVVASGGASVLDEQGVERRFQRGDVVFFPARTSYIWTIEDRIRKVAVVREPLWPPIGIASKVLKKVVRTLTPGHRRASATF